MKYVIEIFENGVRSDVLVTNDDYDWDGYSKLFSDKKASYADKGYVTVKGSNSSECRYSLLFDEDEMKSAVVCAKFYTESDFVDADGQPIIMSKLYRSEDSGDRYSVNEYLYKGMYLRNVDRWDSHVETVNGQLRISRGVGDVYEFDQKYIDGLKLHRI